MSDAEEIRRLRRHVEELSGEIRLVRRELTNSIIETKRAFAYLLSLIQNEHPPPGPAVSAKLVGTPITDPPRKDSP